jgi:hypothetical protein
MNGTFITIDSLKVTLIFQLEMEEESGEVNQSKNHNGKKKKRYISTV